MANFRHPAIGQEVYCPDGWGKVSKVMDDYPIQWIEVQTYVNNRSCHWAPHNVRFESKALPPPATEGIA